MTAVFGEQFFGLVRSPGTCGVVGETARRQRFPDIQDRRHYVPGSLHHVGTLEQGCVAEHAIVEQALVSGLGRGVEVIRVVEIHIHIADLHHRPQADPEPVPAVRLPQVRRGRPFDRVLPVLFVWILISAAAGSPDIAAALSFVFICVLATRIGYGGRG